MSSQTAEALLQFSPDGAQPLPPVDAQTPIAAMTTFRVLPAHECAFAEQGLFLIASVSQSSDVNAFAFHRTLDPRADFVEYALYEDWERCDSFRAHAESQYMKRFYTAIQEFTTGQPIRKLYRGWFKWVADSAPRDGSMSAHGCSLDVPAIAVAAALDSAVASAEQ